MFELTDTVALPLVPGDVSASGATAPQSDIWQTAVKNVDLAKAPAWLSAQNAPAVQNSYAVAVPEGESHAAVQTPESMPMALALGEINALLNSIEDPATSNHAEAKRIVTAGLPWFTKVASTGLPTSESAANRVGGLLQNLTLLTRRVTLYGTGTEGEDFKQWQRDAGKLLSLLQSDYTFNPLELALADEEIAARNRTIAQMSVRFASSLLLTGGTSAGLSMAVNSTSAIGKLWALAGPGIAVAERGLVGLTGADPDKWIGTVREQVLDVVSSGLGWGTSWFMDAADPLVRIGADATANSSVDALAAFLENKDLNTDPLPHTVGAFFESFAPNLFWAALTTKLIDTPSARGVRYDREIHDIDIRLAKRLGEMSDLVEMGNGDAAIRLMPYGDLGRLEQMLSELDNAREVMMGEGSPVIEILQNNPQLVGHNLAERLYHAINLELLTPDQLDDQVLNLVELTIQRQRVADTFLIYNNNIRQLFR